MLAIGELGPRPGPRRLFRVWLAGFRPRSSAYVFAFYRGKPPAERVTVAWLTGASEGQSGRGRLSRVCESAELDAVTPLIAAACNMRGQSSTRWLANKARAGKLFVGRLDGFGARARSGARAADARRLARAAGA